MISISTKVFLILQVDLHNLLAMFLFEVSSKKM